SDGNTGRATRDAIADVVADGPRFSSRWGFDLALKACRDCSDAACDAESRGCSDDSVCKAWFKCRSLCTESRCVADCAGVEPMGSARGNATQVDAENTLGRDYRQCLADHCAIECQESVLAETAPTLICGACRGNCELAHP